MAGVRRGVGGSVRWPLANVARGRRGVAGVYAPRGLAVDPQTSRTGTRERGAQTTGRRPTSACVYSDVRRGGRHDVTRAARARGPTPKSFGATLFKSEFLPIFKLKCKKG
jgi:hypothetical protein